MKFDPIAGTMSAWLSEVPAFPGARFSLAFPEAIGDAASAVWYTTLVPKWEQQEARIWRATGRQPGRLAYEMMVDLSLDDAVVVSYTLDNESDHHWENALAFNCLSCGGARDVRDHDCERHFTGIAGEPVPLLSVPRRHSTRPTVQFYSTAGAPPATDLPFVSAFHATPDVVLDPWVAVCSRDGSRTVATVGRPAAFLFHNREYSCIHAASGFGAIAPGGSATAGNDMLFLDAPLADALTRIRSSMEVGV
ncbi:hypothetical protein [Streptomyces sp. NPDC058623]|uniref:hypothetical protein n=1 Tax=Streptomyces sp. NPDC058623 TaxID=3346563 RepID=UPI00366A09CA